MSETLRDVAVDLAGQLASCEANSAYDGFDAWERRGEYLREYMDRINAADAERTCRMGGIGGWSTCSSCGTWVHRRGVTDTKDYVPIRFCPACGARVVDGDE